MRLFMCGQKYSKIQYKMHLRLSIEIGQKNRDVY